MRTSTWCALVAGRSREHLVARLADRLGRVGIEGVLADLDRAGEHCEVPGAAAAGRGFTWDDADRDDPRWWPQGVAVLRAGSVPGTAGQVLLISWYAKRDRWMRTPGSRITVVDPSHPGGPRYRHVLLVTPRRRPGRPRMAAVPVHAGGIAVRGDLLYVADTVFGLRVFRLSDVLAVRAGSRGGGHGHVLPQFLALRLPLRAGWRRLRFSFLSVGEVDGTPSLVVGEYRRAGDRPPRLARYALDPHTGLPVPDERGRAVPVEVHDHQPRRMQGVAVHGADWFLTASAGPTTPGDLHTGAPGAWHRQRGVLPSGPEDLDWSRPGEELWSLSEWPGRRWVFPIPVRPRPGGQEGSSSAA